MAFKRFISVALASLMVVSSINTGSIRAYASSDESELFTAEEIIEAGEDSEGAELMDEVARSEQDETVSEEESGLADEDVVDDDIIGSDESADEAETVEVTLDANGGLFDGEEEILVINVKAGGSLSDLIDAPSKEGAEFEGWYLDEALTEEVDLNSYVFTENSVLYASWQEIATDGEEEDEDGMSELFGTYFFTIDANGGKLPDGRETLDIAEKTTYLSNYMPEYDGKVFTGWYAEKSCETLLSQSDSGYSRYYLSEQPKAGDVLYAGWADIYTVTFVFGTESGTDPVKNTGYFWDYNEKKRVKTKEYQIIDGETINNYPSDYYIRNTDFHYGFDGYWYRDEARTDKVDSLYNEKPTGNTWYYAGYESKYKVVTFKSNDTTGYFTSDKNDYNYQELEGQYKTIAFIVDDDGYEKSVYTSNVESYAKNSELRKSIEGYYNDEACTDPAANEYGVIKVSADKTVYIKWVDDADRKVVTFDANGGYFSDYTKEDGSPATKVEFDGKYDDGYTTYKDPGKVLNSNAHKRFKGWDTSATATDPEFVCDDDYGQLSVGVDFSKDVTYYAIWEDAYHIITFDANGGYFSNKKQEDGTYATKLEFSGKYNNGYTTSCYLGDVLNSDAHKGIKGWSTDPDATTPEKTWSYYAYYDFSDDATYYAVWYDAYNVVTFDANGGTLSYKDNGDNYITDVSEAVLSTSNNGYLNWSNYINAEDIISPNKDEVFEGWYDEDGKKVTKNYFYEDTTLKAGYTTPYTITLDAGEGTFSYYDNEKGKQINDVKTAEFKTNGSGKITTYPKDEEVEPASDEYLFEGWYIGDEKISSFQYYTFTEDTTVTAHYIAIHTVTFDAGEGKIKYWDSEKYEYVETKELTYETNNMGRVSNFPTNVIPKEGTNTLFEGWYIGDEEIDSYHVFSQNETVTARYIPIYTITFNAVDGKIKHWDSDKGEYVEDQKVIYQTNNKGRLDSYPYDSNVIPATDFVFEGWYVGEDKIDYIYDYTFTGDTEVTAVYVPLYTITFDAGEGGLIRHYDSDKGEYVQDQTVTFKTNKYGKLGNYPDDDDVTPKDGSLFAGWSIEGRKVNYLYDEVFTKDTTVDAVYVPVYTITFNAVSDSGTGKIITGYDDQGNPIKEVTTTRKTNNEFKIGNNYPGSDEVEADSEDYIFKAWSVGGKIVDSMSDYVFAEDTVVTAVYVPAYTITFDAVKDKGLIPTTNEKGETVQVQTLSFKTDGEGKLGWNNYPSDDPIALDGKSLFEAWYDEETGTRIEDLRYRQFYKNTTLSARYNTVYTVTFDAGEGDLEWTDAEGDHKGKTREFTTNGQQKLNNYPASYEVTPPAGKFFDGDWVDKTGAKVELYSHVFTGDTTLYAGYNTSCIVTLDAGEKGSFTYTDEKGVEQKTNHADLETDRWGTLMFYPADKDVSSGVEGTVFEGWYNESGDKVVLAETEFEKNTTLKANFVPSYTVTLDAGDKGTFTYTDEDGIEVPATSKATFKTNGNGKLSIYPIDKDVKAAATGSVFSGWYDEETGRKISSLSSRIFSKDTTLTAHFNEIYTVTLDAGEGGKFSYVDETGTRKTDIPKAEIKTDGQGFLLCYPDDTDVLGPEGTVFDAWYHGEVRISSIGDYVFTKDAKVTAQFVPQKTVTLDAAGGKFSYTDEEGNLQKDKETAQIKVGQNGRLVCYPYDSNVKPADETTLFAGWYLNGKKINLYSYRSYTDGATLTARYTPVYTITLKAEGGRFTYYDSVARKYIYNATEAEIKTGSDGTLTDTPYDMKPSGETVFDGWYDKDGKKISSISSYVFTSDATVTAKFTPKHSITFKAGNGTFSYNDGNYGWVENATEATFLTGADGRLSTYPNSSDVVPADANTIFTGWTDGSRTYTDFYYTSFSKDTELTAVYAAVYTVTLDAKGGKFRYYDSEKGKYIDGVSTATVKTNASGYVNQIGDPVPTDPDMIFEGWYNGTEKISYWYNYKFKGNAEVEAHYTTPVTITLDANGGYFSDGYSRKYTKVITIPQGSSTSLSQPNYQDDVMKFGGWYTDKNWKTAVNSDEYSPTTDSVVYARWYDTHAVTFAYDEADSRGDEQPIATFYVTHGDTFGGNYYGNNNSVPADPVSTIKGRVFTGWFKDAECKNRIEKAEILNYLVTKDVTFYAGFEDFYDVTFNANGGKFVSKPGDTYTARVAKGEAIKKNAPTVVSTETKVFEGWFTEQTGGEEIKNIYDYVPTGDQTLYARYTECYVLTFHANMDGATLDGSAEDVKVRVVKGTAYRYGSEGQDKDYLLAAPILDYSGVTTGKLPYTTDRSETQVGWTTKPDDGNIYFFGRYNHWYYDENGNVNYYPYYGFIPTGNMDFYALWADPISIAFDPSGGEFIEGSFDEEQYGKLNDQGQMVKQYPKGIRLNDVWTPYSSSYMNPKEGYDAISWGYSDAAATTPIGSYTPLMGDTTVYGHWYQYGSGGGKDPVEYGTVYLHSGEGYFWNRGSRVRDMSYPKTEATATVYVKDVPVTGDPNLAFDKWYTDEDLKPEHALPIQGVVSGDEHYFTLTLADGVTDLYAGYDTAYTVTLDANGGYFDDDIDRTKDPDEAMRENTLAIESQFMVGAGIDLTGYTTSIRRDGDKIFGGWFVNAECTEKATLTSYDTSSEFYTPTKDTTLYAAWINYVEPAATLTASADKTALKVGDTATLTASAPGVHWYINSISSDSSSSSSYSSHSSDVSPIALSSDGTVKAQAAGTVSVYAELNGRRSPLVEFTVTSGPVEPTMTLDTTELQLASGQTASVTAWVTPVEDASKVKWSTSKAVTATVTSEVKNGASVATITAGTTTGIATITATYNTGKKTITKTVAVEVVDAIVKLDKNTATITVAEGATDTLALTVADPALAGNDVKWSSSDTSLLTVTKDSSDSKKAVVAVNAAASLTDVAEVTIKAELLGTEYWAECVYTVSPESAIIFDQEALSLTTNSTATLTATVIPSSLTGTFTWSSSDKTVATVTADKNVATINSLGKEGRAIITAKYGKLTKDIEVVVADVISLDKATAELEFQPGTTQELTATVTGDYIDKAVLWSSDNTALLTVTADSANNRKAVVTINDTTLEDVATVTITAALDGTEYAAQCVFTVTPGSALIVDKELVSLEKDGTATVTAKVVPASLKGSYKWVSSNAKVVAVTGNGNVATITAKGVEGEETVTLTYGSLEKKIKVIVADAIALDQSEISFKFEEGQKKTLKATVSEKYKDNQVDWSCDNDVLTITAGTDPNTVVLKVNTAASITQKTKVIVKAALKDTVFFKECVVYVTPPETVEAPRAFIESGIESGSEIASGTTTTVKKDTVISLRSYTEGARIFYTNTTDGTAPADPKIEFDAEGNPKAGAGTTAYESSFKITGQLTVKAIAAAKGRITSVPTTYTFTLDKNQWGDIDNEDTTLKTYLKTAFGDDSGNVKDDIWFVFGNAVDGFEKTELTTGTAGHISKVYDGNKILFNDEVIVYYGTNRLIENRDYTLTFINNTNAAGTAAEKAPSVRITGKGNYKISAVFTFEIAKADIDDAVITSEKVVTILDNAKLTSVNPVVTFNGKKLANNKDYRLDYFNDGACTEEINNPKTAALKPNESYFIRIAGLGGNFTGEKAELVEVKTVEKSAKNVVQVNKLTVSDPQKKLKVNYDEKRSTAEMETQIQRLFEDKVVIVKNGKKELVYGKDYDIITSAVDDGEFIAYQSAGKHSFIIRGTGITGESVEDTYYVGDKTCTLEIVGTALSKAKIAGLFTSVEYTGSEITQTDLFNANDKNLEAAWKEAKLPVLYTVNKSVKTKLTEGTDYTVSMANTGVVGKFNLVYTGINGFTGSVKKVITVKTHGMTAKTGDITVTAEDAVYSKSGAKPKVIVKRGTQVLVEGVDYTVTYKNNLKVAKSTDKAAPTATIKGMGNYAGSGKSATFNIDAAPVSQVSVVANDVVYNAKGKKGYFCVVPKLLDEGKAVSVGKKKDINPIDKNTGYTYEKLTADGWVEIKKTDAASNVSAGDTIKVTVSLANGVNIPYTKDTDSLVGYYKILADQKHNIAKFKVKVDDPQKLYFKAGEPIVLTNSDLIVFMGSEKNPTSVLKAGENYEIVSFTNNNKVGNATLVIRGLGEYGGTKTVTLKITVRKK